MFEYFNIGTVRNAVEDYANTLDLTNFSFEGLRGYDALVLYCTFNPEFELEVTCAYLDYVMFGTANYPKLPESV